MVTKAALSSHLDYTAWASRRLLDAAAALTPEQLQQDFHTADKSVLGTLVHVYAADRIWLARVRSQTLASFISDADYSLPHLQSDWPVIQEGWQQWLDALPEDAIATPIDYKDVKGNAYQNPPWQIVLHVVNHATHHRGQISGFIRTLGIRPPALDMTAYYRSLTR